MISVFGSTGFVGSEFISTYSDECVAVSRESSEPLSDDVLYFISTVDNYNIYDDPYLDINTNLIKLIDVLESCRKSNKNTVFNFVSSWFVYGKTDSLPAKETSVCNPNGFYSITKHAAERLLISYCETYNIPYRILRLTNIIGSTDKKVSKKRNAIQYMIGLLKENKEVKLYDDGGHIRDYMDVKDCCRAIKTTLDTAPKNVTINISNSEPTKIGDIIKHAKRKIGSESKISYIPTPEFHKIVQIQDMFLDNTRLLELGYKPSISTLESINMLLENR